MITVPCTKYAFNDEAPIKLFCYRRLCIIILVVLNLSYKPNIITFIHKYKNSSKQFRQCKLFSYKKVKP